MIFLFQIYFYLPSLRLEKGVGGQHPVIHLYFLIEHHYTHSVGRVLSFSPVVGIGTPPTPYPQASVPPPLPPPPGSGGRGTTLAHSLARGGWESPNPGKGTFTLVLYKYTYFVTVPVWMRLATPQPRPHMVLPAVVIIPSVQVVVLLGQKVAVPATSGRIFKEMSVI